MIRSNQQGTATRRIAVIQIPRPQRARMGSIIDRQPARYTTEAWTTISDAVPDSSDNWLSYKLLAQARARETTPGTLIYTPASDTAAMNTAPWNSWIQPNCPASADAAAAAAAASAHHSSWWLLFGFLGAAASLHYLVSSSTKAGR